MMIISLLKSLCSIMFYFMVSTSLLDFVEELELVYFLKMGFILFLFVFETYMYLGCSSSFGKCECYVYSFFDLISIISFFMVYFSDNMVVFEFVIKLIKTVSCSFILFLWYVFFHFMNTKYFSFGLGFDLFMIINFLLLSLWFYIPEVYYVIINFLHDNILIYIFNYVEWGEDEIDLWYASFPIMFNCSVCFIIIVGFLLPLYSIFFWYLKELIKENWFSPSISGLSSIKKIVNFVYSNSGILMFSYIVLVLFLPSMYCVFLFVFVYTVWSVLGFLLWFSMMCYPSIANFINNGTFNSSKDCYYFINPSLQKWATPLGKWLKSVVEMDKFFKYLDMIDFNESMDIYCETPSDKEYNSVQSEHAVKNEDKDKSKMDKSFKW